MTLDDRFRTPAAAAQFRAAYDESLALSGVSCEAITVNTRYGMTHVNAPEAPPDSVHRGRSDPRRGTPVPG
ncbi:MAG: hypothetical protein K8I60_10775 [Anaerolineae bacterium]|nr:hypothetical protein [Anaerolineae bacterium]